jgi:ribulose-bisphosphate carboxylase large chain
MGRFCATYHISAAPDEIRARAQALALEQSIEMPLEAVRDARVRQEVAARVGTVEPAAGGGFRITLEIATETTGEELTQLINMLFGNCSLQDDVTLEDVALPETFLKRFGGPRFGIDGLRSLCDAPQRALTCTALKPQGSSTADLAALCETFAVAGIDVIKDDHGLADQRAAPFEDRVVACQRAVDRAAAATGRTALYAPSLVGSPQTLLERARFARDAGVRVVLVAPMLVGLPAFRELVERFDDLAFLAHPAFGGATRIEPAWLFGRFFRLLGADAVIYPNYGGRFAYSAERCRALADAARAPWDGVRPALPVPAGGMSVARVDEILAFYGKDVMLLIGGGLLSAGDALAERSREFVAKVTSR